MKHITSSSRLGEPTTGSFNHSFPSFDVTVHYTIPKAIRNMDSEEIEEEIIINSIISDSGEDILQYTREKNPRVLEVLEIAASKDAQQTEKGIADLSDTLYDVTREQI